MAVPAHDERDFEFARKYRLPIRIVVRSDETPATAAELTEATTNYGRLVDSGEYIGRRGAGRDDADDRRRREARHRQGRGAVPPEGLGHLAPALLGHADPDRLLREGRRRRRAVRAAAGGAAEGRAVHGPRRFAAGAGAGVRQRDVPEVRRPGAARDRHDGHVRRLVVVFPPVLRPAEQRRCRSARRPPRTGCRWTSTAAASSTRSCTCCTRGSSRASCATSAWSTFDEPFKRLLTQGMVLKDGSVMSKSKGNVVDPDDMLAEVRRRRAAALRDVRRAAGEGSRVERRRPRGQLPVPGARLAARRPLGETIGGQRACRARRRTAIAPTPSGRCAARRTTRSAASTVDIEERMHLNTAVSSLMELVNELYAFSEAHAARRAVAAARRRPARSNGRRRSRSLREALDALVLMLSPFAPHTAEELWQMLGHAGGLARAAWPAFDAEVAKARRSRRAGSDQRQGPRAADRPGRRDRRRAARRWRWPTPSSARTPPARRSGRSSSPRGRSSVWWSQ